MKPEEAFYFAENHPELLAGALINEDFCDLKVEE